MFYGQGKSLDWCGLKGYKSGQTGCWKSGPCVIALARGIGSQKLKQRVELPVRFVVTIWVASDFGEALWMGGVPCTLLPTDGSLREKWVQVLFFHKATSHARSKLAIIFRFWHHEIKEERKVLKRGLKIPSSLLGIRVRKIGRCTI